MLSKNNWEFASDCKTTHCSAKPSSATWSAIDSTSVIAVSPRYHFSLPSYHDFCKSYFCYPTQNWTLGNNCEKWAEKGDKTLLPVKKICRGDWEADARSIHWWGMAWRFGNLPLAEGLFRRQKNYWIASPCWVTIEHLHRRNGEYSRIHSSRSLSHHCLTTCSSSGYFKIIC